MLCFLRSVLRISDRCSDIGIKTDIVENVSKTVLPLEASIYFEDNDGNKISNEVIIFADRNSEYAQDRQFKEKFTLKRMTYSKSKKYYLIIKDGQTDLEIDRVEFMIDIAFQDGFDFF